MSKELVREIKTHCKQRWEIYRHNVKHPENKKLFLEEKFVLNNVLPGTILAYNCLGEMYQGLLPVVTETESLVTNVLLINPIEFRYAEQSQIVDHIAKVIQYLNKPGRLIINLNLFTIIYDRLNVCHDTYIKSLTQQLTTLGLKQHRSSLRTDQITNGYGHLFMSFDYE